MCRAVRYYMNKAKKVCVVTGSRAEYGLLYWLMKEVDSSKDLELQIIVTGMHLSSEFGLTYKQIEKDGFSIGFKVDMLLASDSEKSISNWNFRIRTNSISSKN